MKDKIDFMIKKINDTIDIINSIDPKILKISKSKQAKINIILGSANNDYNEINERIYKLIINFENIIKDNKIPSLEKMDLCKTILAMQLCKKVIFLKLEIQKLELFKNELRCYKEKNVIDATIKNKDIINTIPNIEDYRYIEEEIEYLKKNAKDKNIEISNALARLESIITEIDNIKDDIQITNNLDNISQNINNIRDIIENYRNFILEKMKKSKNLYYQLKVGVEGEKEAFEELSIHKNFKMLKNRRIKDKNNLEAECDIILVCKKGIFVLEVKNIGLNNNFYIDIDKTGRWSKIYNNKRSYVMHSATKQNNRHIAVINNILNDNNINLVSKGMVVVPNDKVTIYNKSTLKVVRTSHVYDIICNSTINISDTEVESIYNILDAASIPLKRYKFRNYIEEGKLLIKSPFFVSHLNKIEEKIKDINFNNENIIGIEQEMLCECTSVIDPILESAKMFKRLIVVEKESRERLKKETKEDVKNAFFGLVDFLNRI